MTKVVIKRVAENGKGTFGVLLIDNRPVCCTLELPWVDNKRNASCIPAGKYNATKHNGSKYKNVWAINPVPDRSGILIHAGNTIKDTEGCILVGMKYSENGVAESQVALSLLRSILPDAFDIEVQK